VGIEFSFNDAGLKELQRKLKDLQGQQGVSISELLPDDFIQKYTDFQTLQAMFDASGIENPEEIDSKKFSKFVATHTHFANWEEMLKVAGAEYTKRQLGL
jgi:hypothetical protein